MITKFLSKLKSILFKSESPSVIPEAKKITKKIKKKSAKSPIASKSKTKKQDPKKLIEALKAIPGVGAKSAEAFYKAGFKTPKSISAVTSETILINSISFALFFSKCSEFCAF